MFKVDVNHNGVNLLIYYLGKFGLPESNKHVDMVKIV